MCSGYEVTTATRSVQDSSNADGLRHASHGEPASRTTGRGASRWPRSARTVPPPGVRSRVLTWSAQVGLGRGRRQARRRGAGASPLPTSQPGAHLGDFERKRSLGSASPGNTGGPAGRQEEAAEEELDGAATVATATGAAAAAATCTWRPAHVQRPRGRRFPPPCPALPTRQVSRRTRARPGEPGDPRAESEGW